MRKKIVVVLSVIILILASVLTIKILKSGEVSENKKDDSENDKKAEMLSNNISVDKDGNINNIDNTFTYIKLDETNCEYFLNEEEEKVTIQEYEGIEDIIIIPQNINGYEVGKIEKEAFIECYNLEKILISENITKNIRELQDFKVNEKQDVEGYTEYITTREYGETYKEYINFSDEEKAIQEIIPYKFDIPLERVFSRQMKEQYESDEEIPMKFDLQNQIDIEVENQRSHGTCYAYASLTTIETNLALKKSEYVDLSEIHCAVMTGKRLWRFVFNC